MKSRKEISSKASISYSNKNLNDLSSCQYLGARIFIEICFSDISFPFLD